MAIRSRFPLRLLAALLALAALTLLPARSGAEPKTPVIGQLALLTSPTLGGQAQVIWAGSPQVTPTEAELTFVAIPPQGGARPKMEKKSITLTQGRAGDATFSFPTPRPGVYRVESRLKMKVGGQVYQQRSELKVNVAPQPKRRDGKAAKAAAAKPGKKAGLQSKANKVEVTNPQELPLGPALRQGELSVDDETDWWHIKVEQETALLIESEGDDFSVTMSLYDKDLDEPLTAETHDLKSPRLAPGDYYLAVEAYYSDYTGVYQIRAEKFEVKNPQELPLNGNWQTAELGVQSEHDWWHIKVATAGILDLNLEESDYDSQLYGVWFELYDKDLASNIAVNSNGWTSRKLDPGDYYLEVYSYDADFRNQTIPYQIKASRLEAKNTQELTLNGKSPAAAISVKDEIDWWHFKLEQVAAVDIDALSDHLSARLTLFDKSMVAPIDTGEYGIVSPKLQPGDYYLAVESLYGDERGDYQLKSRTLMVNNARELGLDGERIKAELSEEDELDWWHFKVERETFVDINTTGGNIDVYLWLYDKDIDESIDAGYNGLSQIKLKPGDYYLAVEAYNSGDTGAYQLQARTPQTLTPLAVGGGKFRGTFFGGEVDAEWYRFEVEASGSYIIETGATDGTKMSLYGPDDQEELLERDDDGGWGYAAMISRELDEGTYYVKVEQGASYDWYDSGYDISVRKGARNVTELTVDAPARQVTFASSDVDYDRYRFEVEEAGFYTIDCKLKDFQGWTYLYYCGGREDNVDDGWSNFGDPGETVFAQQFRLAPGVYYFKIQGDRYDDSGDDDDEDGVFEKGSQPDYEIRVRKSSAPVLEIGETRQDVKLVPGANQRWLQFTVKERGACAVLALPLGYYDEATITLYDEAMTKIGSASTGDESAPLINATLDPGVYTINITSFVYYWSIAGRFKVMILDHPLTMLHATGSGQIDKWIKGSIAAPGGEAWYLTYGYFYNSISTTSGTLADTDMTLYGPNDDRVKAAEDDDSGPGAMARISAFVNYGAYYFVKVKAGQSGATGSFSVGLTSPSFEEIGTLCKAGENLKEGDIGHFSFSIDDETTRTIELVADTLPGYAFRLYEAEKDQEDWGYKDPVLIAERRVDGVKLFKLSPAFKEGRYYIEIVSVRPADVGKYAIRIRKDFEDVALDRNALNNDEIVTAGEGVWSTFELAAAEDITVSLVLDTLAGGDLRLYGPGNATQLLAEATTGAGRAGVIRRVLQPGRYYVRVQAHSAEDKGTFSLQVKPTFTRLRLGARPIREVIGFHGEEDAFTFDVNEMTSITVETFTKWSWSLKNNVISLYGPDDASRLAATDDDCGVENLGRIVATLLPGRYVLWVKGKTLDNMGAYSVQARETNTTLTLDGAWVAAALRDPTECEWFHFTVPTTHTVTIDTHDETYRRYPEGMISDAALELYSTSSTTPIATDADSGPHALPHLRKALRPGCYSVKISGAKPTDLGYFLIRVRDGFTGLAVDGESKDGEINDPNCAEWFAFKVEQAGNYDIRLSGSYYGATHISNAVLSLHGPNCMTPLEITATSDQDYLAKVTTPLEPGWYYICVKGKAETDLGYFFIKVSKTAAAQAKAR